MKRKRQITENDVKKIRKINENKKKIKKSVRFDLEEIEEIDYHFHKPLKKIQGTEHTT